MVEIEIRSLRKDELEEAWRLHEKGFPYLDEISKEDYLRFRSDPNFDLNQIVVADFGGKLVGKVEWGKELEEERTAFIDGFIVDPAYRRRGIGTRLLLEAEERARRQGASRLELGVKTFSGAAIALYEKLGYERLHRVLFMKIPLAQLQIKELPNNVCVRFADSSQDLEEFLKMDQVVWWNKITRRQLQKEITERRENFLVLESNGRIQAFLKYGTKKVVNIHLLGISKALRMPLPSLLRCLFSGIATKVVGRKNLYLEVDDYRVELVNALEELGFKTYEVEFHMQKHLI